MSDVTAIFKALSDPTRLAVYNCIRCCGFSCGYDTESGQCCCGNSVSGSSHCNSEGADDAEGVAACRIRCQVPCAPSTLTHHLNELRSAGLIATEKRGRIVYCRVLPGALAQIAAFISGK